MSHDVFASTHHLVIQSVLSESFRFETREQALSALARIRHQYKVEHEADLSQIDTLTLWIKGFGLTEEERKQGFLGHYAHITIRPTADSRRWCLHAEKVQLKQKHPQRKRPQYAMPDLQHPLLRGLKKPAVHPTLEAAQAQMQRMHEAFPEISLPTPTRLYILIYRKDKPANAQSGGTKKPRVQRHIVAIEPHASGGFILSLKENKRARSEKKAEKLLNKMQTERGVSPALLEARREANTEASRNAAGRVVQSGQTSGYFTAREQIRGKRKGG